jgi:hypothetical protein
VQRMTELHDDADVHQHGSTEVEDGAATRRLHDRRAFMKRLMVASGGAAFATMGLTHAAQAQDTTTTPAAGGTPPTGAPSGTSAAAGAMAEGITDDFVGLTTNGYVVDDLYTIHSTGVSTAPVRAAATAFLATLSATQLSSVKFAVHSTEWRLWSNVDGYTRNGIDLAAMSDAQKAAVTALLKAGLSAKGLTLTEKIRQINGLAGAAINATSRFASDLYYVTVMGTPSATQPWGFQIDGHHLVINYFVLGDQVVMSPCFYGSEPTSMQAADGSTVTVFTEELAAGLALINSLTTAQKAKAIISTTKNGDNNLAEAFKDNLIQAYKGLNVAKLATAQRKKLLALIELFVGNVTEKQAAVKMAEVKANLDETYLAWVGGTASDAVFYFRIQSPVLWIEFDCETPGPLGSIYGSPTTPTRNHIHSVVRTPNGNDYGKDLLRQHYLTSPHHN